MAYRRFLNRDGSFNIRRVGARRRRRYWRDLYHTLLRVSWARFFLGVLVSYFLVNLIFATAYFLAGPAALEGTLTHARDERFLDCFFFSVQTFATIGYGRIAPVGILANCLVTCEALVGLMGLAVTTGLLFNRFSRPTARVEFSRLAVIEAHDGVPSFIFRVVNMRLNQIVDAEVTVVLTRNETTQEGERFRNYYELELERSRSPVFALSWTVVHPLAPDSPLYGQSLADLVASEVELIISLTGTDDTFSQTIHARYSYLPDEISWDRSFADMLSRSPEGEILIDVARLHELKS